MPVASADVSCQVPLLAFDPLEAAASQSEGKVSVASTVPESAVPQSAGAAPVRILRMGEVPIVVSINWDNTSPDPTKHLDGASIEKTGGHLMVVRGFTATGDVIANDPASPDDASVRHVYRRDQFEYRWQAASAGATYVIKPYGVDKQGGED